MGREKEVAAAKELLLRQDVRLVTITGPGGIGKTRLGVEVASRLARKLSRGHSFCSALLPERPRLDRFGDRSDVGDYGRQEDSRRSKY